MSNCQQCIALNQIVQRQQAEIERLRGIINNAQTACNQLVTEADNKMTGNIPRGKWAFCKGARGAAEVINRRLVG